MRFIKKFKVDTKELSPKEKVLFNKLILAAELIAPLYLRQKNDKYPAGNFYPHDATKEEIIKAAEKNPAILNPYTFVERNGLGKLIAIPFHIKFKKELEKICKILRDAAELSEDKNLKKYLKAQAKCLFNGNYQKSEVIWLKNTSSKIGFVIGPIERYLDKLFFKKCAYQAWVGIVDKKRTEEAGYFKNLILVSRRKFLPGTKKIEVQKLVIRVEKTVIFSGLISDFMFTGTNLPNDVKMMEKHGSLLTIFKTSLDSKFDSNHYPVFNKIFRKDFQKIYSKKELYQGSLRCIFLHEIAHSLIRYRDAEERLKDFFPIFDEIYAYILGIKVCGMLLLKDALNQKELEAIMIMHICRNFTWWIDSLKNPNVSYYAIGAAIAHNFYLKEGGIEEKGGISWPNFSKMLICIDLLCRLFEYQLSLENYDEARKFVKQYGSFESFEKFSPQLEKFI